MGRRSGDSPRKLPYELVKHKMSSRGMMVAVIEDMDTSVYYVGLGLTVSNINNPPYGCLTYYDKDEALSDYETDY